ncbi:MAG: YiiD C-terminal domain-containing protein [Gammaproteobacteria bacterium]|nr:YiiD C-terminal domain-containing protein [Gammaproteobacteria bacterium]
MNGFCAAYWNERLHREIPATQLLKLTVEEVSPDKISLSSPLEPNLNGHGTGFAGSIYTIGITTGWTYLNAWERELGLNAKIVALDAAIRYSKPITDTIHANNESSISERAYLWPELLTNKKKFTERISILIGDSKVTAASKLDILFHISKR